MSAIEWDAFLWTGATILLFASMVGLAMAALICVACDL